MKRGVCAEQALGRSRQMFAGFSKIQIRPALERELQVHARGRQVDQGAGMIHREILIRLAAKLLELLRVLSIYPARREYIHVVEGRLHAVLVLQPNRDDVELQLTDRSQDQFVIAQRAEDLRRAFFALLIQTLLQRLHAQRILEHDAAEELGRE